MIGKLGAIAAVAMLALSPVAKAGDANGNFQIKAGYTGILWDNENHGIFANGAKIANASAEVRDLSLPTATLTYFLTKNIGVELFCCFAHGKVRGTDALKAAGDIANAWTFPPILTLKYSFDGMGAIRPYVGVGAQWVHFFNERSTLGGFKKVDFEDSFGFALQAGFDYNLGSGWSFGLDVKKVWEDTKVTFSDNAGNKIVTRHDMDPLLITANIGYRFNLFGPAASAPLK